MPRHKLILQGKEARLKLKQGVDLVADTIKTTLGPKGRNVIVKNLGPLPPRSFNDGYYIADHIQHDDAIVNAGVDMVKEICKKTNDVAGDGTTSTAILSQRLIDNGLKEVERGRNPVDIKNELNADLKNVLAELKTLSKPVENDMDVKNIAMIAGNNDEEIGKALRDIYLKVGKNSQILVEKSGDSNITTTTVKGIYFDTGFGEARAFVNKPASMTAEYSDVLVLCVDEKLEYVDDIAPFINKLIEWYGKDGKSSWDIRLLIIANEFPVRMDACTVLAENNRAALLKQVNKEKGLPEGFYVVGVQAPEFGATREEILDDIAIATGGICVSKANGLELKSVEPGKVLGRAEKIIVETNSTTIIGGNASLDELTKRISMINGEMDQLHVNAKVTREKFEKRLQTISAGVAIIHAGGSTEMESKERHLRIEDAVLAVKSAQEEGYCVGGGYTYYRLSKVAKTSLLRDACVSIVEQIAENAGKNQTEVINHMETFTESGYNALTDTFEDLLKAGVIDSTKVIKIALMNAVSLASLFLTTSSVIIEEVIDEEIKK
jgi:chaperonin GroEL